MTQFLTPGWEPDVTAEAMCEKNNPKTFTLLVWSQHLKNCVGQKQYLTGENYSLSPEAQSTLDAQAQMQANGTWSCEWQCSHWTQATSKELRSRNCLLLFWSFVRWTAKRDASLFTSHAPCFVLLICFNQKSQKEKTSAEDVHSMQQSRQNGNWLTWILLPHPFPDIDTWWNKRGRF